MSGVLHWALLTGSGVSSAWVIGLGVIGYASALLVDATAAWRGIYQWGPLMLIVLSFCQTLVFAYGARGLGVPDEEALLLALFALFIVGMFAYFERLFDTARAILRVLRGFRVSGILEEAMVVAAVPGDLVQDFGVDFLEKRLGQEVAKALKAEDDPFPSSRAKLSGGLRLMKVATPEGEAEFLFAVGDGLARALCIPEDGVVARLEKGRASALNLSFSLRQIHHLTKPNDEELSRARRELAQAFGEIARPRVAVRPRTILGYSVAFAFVIFMVLAVLNLNQIVEMLSRAGTALGAVASLIVIASAVYLMLRRLATWYRGK